jgi:hypothetical protein
MTRGQRFASVVVGKNGVAPAIGGRGGRGSRILTSIMKGEAPENWQGMKALMHVTLPPLGPFSPAFHFSPLVALLEGVITVNRTHIRQSLNRAAAGLGQPIPPLYSAGIPYREDPFGQENWGDVLYCLQCGWADCVPLSTLVMRDDYEFVPLGDLKPGDRIMGDGQWTTVQDTMRTGEKEILRFKLSNSCTLRCSPDHRLFRDVDGTIEEVRARDVMIGDDLVTPRSIPTAEMESLAWPESLLSLSLADRMWLLGVFIADGWVPPPDRGYGPYSCSISGQDGKPKEEQKRRVQALMNSINVETTWKRKYITIRDRSITGFFAKCGHLAPNKRLPALGLTSKEAIEAMIEGLSADASTETRPGHTPGKVYGTTSPTLALQLRALFRMIGVSASIRCVKNHGGFGDNAIYRVIPRVNTRPREGTEHYGYAERRDKIFARVRSISVGESEECGDITTDTGKFWLPESDVLVHNCDRLVLWRCAEAREAGVWVEPVIKWQHLTKQMAISVGYPADEVDPDGVWLVHCCVKWPVAYAVTPDPHPLVNAWCQMVLMRPSGDPVEDPSKELGMGGEYTTHA